MTRTTLLTRIVQSPLLSLAVVALFALACGPATATEKQMLDWGNALNMHLGTGGNDGDYAYPKKGLEEIDSSLAIGLTTTDAWGNELHYRRIRDDLYQLISAGVDGELGNEDDLVLQNGAFYETTKIYAERPLQKKG